ARQRRARGAVQRHAGQRLHVVARRADRGRRGQHPAQHHRRARARPAPRPGRRAPLSRARTHAMNLGLSQDQILLRATIRRFLDEQWPTTRVRQVMESDSGHDAALWSGLVELGVTGLYVPAEHGGAGLELLDLALAAEELGYNATPGPFLANALAQIALA